MTRDRATRRPWMLEAIMLLAGLLFGFGGTNLLPPHVPHIPWSAPWDRLQALLWMVQPYLGQAELPSLTLTDFWINRLVVAGLGLGALAVAYLGQNLVSFGVAAISVPFWMGLALLFSLEEAPTVELRGMPSAGTGAALGLGAALALGGIALDARTLRADLGFAFASQAQAQVGGLDRSGIDECRGIAGYAYQRLAAWPGGLPPARGAGRRGERDRPTGRDRVRSDGDPDLPSRCGAGADGCQERRAQRAAEDEAEGQEGDLGGAHGTPMRARSWTNAWAAA